jgi:hypothetical protein
VLEAPIREHQERWLAALQASPAEIAELSEMGRVQLVVPQSFDRYDPGILNAVVARAPAALLLSRRLAGACIVDSMKRVLLQPGMSFEHRATFIRALSDAARNIPDGDQRRIAAAMLDTYKDAWLGAERAWNRMGAMAPMFFGIGRLLANVLQAMRNVDRTIELSTASLDRALNAFTSRDAVLVSRLRRGAS